MTAFSRFQKYALGGICAITGATLYYYRFSENGQKTKQIEFFNTKNTSEVMKFVPTTKWDSNWDKRDPKSMVKPMKIKSTNDENDYNEKLDAQKPHTVRHLLLIRHGQYNLAGQNDAERILTDLGRRQAESTGKRLAELALPYSLIIRSTMARAQETSKIIEKSLMKVPVIDDSILVEGSPIPPEPPIGHWKAESQYFQDGPRIEAAFRKYFHRASPRDVSDSYTIIVCHANVIRYFVCRALQFPPEAWLRLSLKHASITWVSIHPSGRVTLRCFGDSGHMLPEYLTTS
ncbi:serine/threonine-protein phosphatase Pgam5, mitochondrial-like [Chelonus insularis]|uniref:serine/threonine-protein phosphatase Pgam5, mitochondrial-like n=1 Tax=Chelonus insularis TaxID=460826 RepID=UPI00158BA061|nr:serine/threonine-protein phosphatase Pgam5, mitochondrial-like [Chelonus insularis]